jgi:DNA-directed RNA polymerase subunit M/transcription elongation factor TFIIS
MRWRQTFVAEVMESLQRLGLRACPVCGSAESLSMGPCPVLLVDGGIPSDADAVASREDGDGDLTFAVRVECTTCGHLMLFNAQRFRTADDKILVSGRAEGDGHVA